MCNCWDSVSPHSKNMDNRGVYGRKIGQVVRLFWLINSFQSPNICLCFLALTAFILKQFHQCVSAGISSF